jgi:hypothetical protein
MNSEEDILTGLRGGAKGFFFIPITAENSVEKSPVGDYRILLEAGSKTAFGPYANNEEAACRFRELYGDQPRMFAMIFSAAVIPSVTPDRMREVAAKEAKKVPAHPDNHDGDKCRLCSGALAKSSVDYMGDVEVAGRRYVRYCPKCEQRPPSYGGKIRGEQYERETDIPEYLYLRLLAQEAAGKEEQEKPPGFLERHGIHLRLGN